MVGGFALSAENRVYTTGPEWIPIWIEAKHVQMMLSHDFENVPKTDFFWLVATNNQTGESDIFSCDFVFVELQVKTD